MYSLDKKKIDIKRKGFAMFLESTSNISLTVFAVLRAINIYIQHAVYTKNGISILKSKFSIINHITYTQFNTCHNTESIPFYIISLIFSSKNVSGSSGCKAITPQSRASKKILQISIFVLTVKKHLDMKILK